jgi:hypothetical protein
MKSRKDEAAAKAADDTAEPSTAGKAGTSTKSCSCIRTDSSANQATGKGNRTNANSFIDVAASHLVNFTNTQFLNCNTHLDLLFIKN